MLSCSVVASICELVITGLLVAEKVHLISLSLFHSLLTSTSEPLECLLAASANGCWKKEANFRGNDFLSVWVCVSTMIPWEAESGWVGQEPSMLGLWLTDNLSHALQITQWAYVTAVILWLQLSDSSPRPSVRAVEKAVWGFFVVLRGALLKAIKLFLLCWLMKCAVELVKLFEPL